MSSSSKDYGKALKALREREIFELQLAQTNYSYETFSSYLQWELSNGPKVHITPLTTTLFERALVTWWQQPSIWEDYAHFAVLPSIQRPKSRFKNESMKKKLPSFWIERSGIVGGAEISGVSVFDSKHK